MACPLPHTFDEIQALVTKLIDEDIIRQKALMELAVQFENASTTKCDFRKRYEKCYDITHESRALVDTFFKSKQFPHSETHRDGSSSEQHAHQPTYPITQGFLTEKEYQQLLQDEDALRQTLKEEARAETK
nr:hypothetical protein [Tanacetum cinerariifolium]